MFKLVILGTDMHGEETRHVIGTYTDDNERAARAVMEVQITDRTDRTAIVLEHYNYVPHRGGSILSYDRMVAGFGNARILRGRR